MGVKHDPVSIEDAAVDLGCAIVFVDHVDEKASRRTRASGSRAPDASLGRPLAAVVILLTVRGVERSLLPLRRLEQSTSCLYFVPP